MPVFNTRPALLERAVSSVLDQTYARFELVLIDDGSAEETANELDRIALRDNRVVVMHQANSGVSAARNAGVRIAHGSFVAYLDSDDYLLPSFLADAVATVQRLNAEVVFGGLRVLHPAGTANWRAVGPSSEDAEIGTEAMREEAAVRALSDSPTTEMPTTSLSVTNVVATLYEVGIARGFPFREGMSQAEDRLHNVEILLAGSRAVFCSDPWYVYDQTDQSGATRGATSETAAAIARTIREFATIGEAIADRDDVAPASRARIRQAAGTGVLKYLKVLTGVMAITGERGGNRRALAQVLSDPSTASALVNAEVSTRVDSLFANGARHCSVRLLLLLGRLWVRRGGLQMTAGDVVDPPAKAART